MEMRRLRRGLSQASIAALAGLIALSACDPDVPRRDAPEERVSAIFDPDTQTVPLPNDMAMVDGRLPTLPGAGEESAEGALLGYLPQLRGWLPGTAIEIPFGGALDEATISSDSVLLFRFVEGELEEMEISALPYAEREDGVSLIRVVPAEPLLYGEQYAAVVTKGVHGANGLPVMEPQPLFFAASAEPLVDVDGEPTLSVLEDLEPAQVAALEQMRLLLAPVYESLEEEGIARNEVAMAFRWTVMPNTAAAFNPDLRMVPIPNTAALDPDGTFPRSATCFAGQNNANGTLDDYLSGLSGWPDATPITLPLTGPIDFDTVTAEAVQLWRLEGGTWERVEDLEVIYHTEAVDSCTGEVSEAYSLEIRFEGGMQIRENYFAFATRAIEDEDGHSIIPDMPIYMAMQPHPIVDGEGNSLVSNFSDEQAQSLAGVQALVRPALDVIEDEVGLDYTDLASVWSWFTWNDTFIVFDPATAQIPFPNEFLRPGGQVTLPVNPEADPLTQGIFQTLNQRTGFSTTAPGWVPVDGVLDAETVNHGSVAIAPEQGANTRLLGSDMFTIEYRPEWGHIVVEPTVPFRANQLHAGVITKDMLGANGRPVQPTPAFVFLRSQHRLYDASTGQSLVYALDNETAAALEDARNSYSQLFFLALIIDGVRFARERIVNAWAFQTEDPSRYLQEFRALAMDVLDERSELTTWRACDVDGNCQAGGGDSDFVEFDTGEVEDPNNPGTFFDMSNVEAAHLAGEFQTVAVNRLEGTVAEGSSVGISVFVPRAAQDGGSCAAPFDVVIAQHGLGSDRWRAGLGMANEFAAYPHCLATVAMDLPLHGGRSVGSATLHPGSTPANSGQDFLTADLLTSKTNFVQGIVDLYVLSRIVQAGGLESLVADLNGGGPYFSDSIGYVGTSLGGILGVPFAALDPAVDTAVINAAGGRLSWVLAGDEEGPSVIGEGILAAFGQMGIEPGSFSFVQTMAFVQWVADVIDPFALAPVAVSGERRNLAYDGEDFVSVTGDSCEVSEECPSNWRCVSEVCVEYLPAVQFLLQKAEGDRTVVNRSTDALAAALGVSLDDTTFEEVPHSFMSIRDESDPVFAEGLCARLQAAQWLSSGLTSGLAELTADLSAAACLQ